MRLRRWAQRIVAKFRWWRRRPPAHKQIVYQFSADDLPLVDGMRVESWHARVGDYLFTHVELSQPEPSRQPIYRAPLGVSPYVDFDGTDDLLRYADQAAASGDVFMAGDGIKVWDLIVYDGALTDKDRADIAKWLNEKHGITPPQRARVRRRGQRL